MATKLISGDSPAAKSYPAPQEVSEWLIIKEMGWTYTDLDNLSYHRYRCLIAMINGSHAGEKEAYKKLSSKKGKRG